MLRIVFEFASVKNLKEEEKASELLFVKHHVAKVRCMHDFSLVIQTFLTINFDLIRSKYLMC